VEHEITDMRTREIAAAVSRGSPREAPTNGESVTAVRSGNLVERWMEAYWRRDRAGRIDRARSGKQCHKRRSLLTDPANRRVDTRITGRLGDGELGNQVSR
jgi:hypothetical protein